ncbi:MAG: hypothetical protein ABI564_00210 [Ideonella sp.]
MSSVRKRLATGGVLICANLELARRSVARQLLNGLDDLEQWQREPSIEGGRTHVFIKRGA